MGDMHQGREFPCLGRLRRCPSSGLITAAMLAGDLFYVGVLVACYAIAKAAQREAAVGASQVIGVGWDKRSEVPAKNQTQIFAEGDNPASKSLCDPPRNLRF